MDLPIIIIGSGVSGLVVAQGLKRHSIPFRLFERYSKLRGSQGHRFRVWTDEGQEAFSSVLSPELKDLMQRTMAQKHEFGLQYLEAETMGPVNLGEPVSPLGSLPLDRTWLVSLLSIGIEDSIEYEKEFASYELTDDGVTANFKDGTSVRGRFLIGADGLRSKVRKQLQPDRKFVDTRRQIIWGRTPLTPELDSHLQIIPLKRRMINQLKDAQNNLAIVDRMEWASSIFEQSGGKLPDTPPYIYWAVFVSPEQVAKHSVPDRKEMLLKVTENWHPDMKYTFKHGAAETISISPLYSSKLDIEISQSDHQYKVTLVGDAAHPMSPMGGTGGDTAIRSAADLVHTIGEQGISPDSIRGFLERLEERARQRIDFSFRRGEEGGQENRNEYQEIEL